MSTMLHTITYIVCGRCGHHNRLDRSARQNMKMILAGTEFACRGQHCTNLINTSSLPTFKPTKMRRELRRELQAAGITPVC